MAHNQEKEIYGTFHSRCVQPNNIKLLVAHHRDAILLELDALQLRLKLSSLVHLNALPLQQNKFRHCFQSKLYDYCKEHLGRMLRVSLSHWERWKKCMPGSRKQWQLTANQVPKYRTTTRGALLQVKCRAFLPTPISLALVSSAFQPSRIQYRLLCV